jgi:CubicO group peptidase (beta-lactamase class C family)
MWMRLPGDLAALAVVAAVLSAAAAPSQPADTRARVDAIFGRWTISTPGCTVGSNVNGQPAVRAAYGMADLEHDVPIAVDTIFEAGSVSKQFTATAVLLLAREGKLSLDDPVRKHLPELPDVGAPVTIRHMLQHTSGLRDWGILAAIAGWPRGSRVHTHAHVLDILTRQRALNFQPGTRWSYSNSGYNLAAILVARLSGTSFADFTKARIFEPLGMKDTSWRDDYRRIVKRRAVAYREQQGTFATDMPFENVHGNGGLLTTVGDLLKWNENFAAPAVGDAALLAELQRPATFNDGRSHEYALGLYVDTYRGVREVDHSGGTAGYRAHLARYPDHGVSVAVLCNVGSANATSYAKAVADLHLGDALRPATAPAAAHELTEQEAGRLAGLYRRLPPAAPGALAIVQNQRRLRVRDGAYLVPASARRLVKADDGQTLEFEGNGRMRATDEFGTVDAYERTEPVKPTPGQLKEYAGRYVSDEIETVVDVSVEGDTLVLQRRPDSSVRLTPIYAGGFVSPLGWVTFHRDASGRVVGLGVSQDRVWDLRFTRQAGAATAVRR